MKVRNIVCVGLLCCTVVLSGCGDKAVSGEGNEKVGTAVEVIEVSMLLPDPASPITPISLSKGLRYC